MRHQYRYQLFSSIIASKRYIIQIDWTSFKIIILIKLTTNGRKNLIKIPITKSLSITHRVAGNFGACKIIMRPSIEGSGVIAGGSTRIVLELAGIKNILSKQLGSNNLLNNARATVEGLSSLRSYTL